MKSSLIAISALASGALAMPRLLNINYNVQEGKPFTLEYSGCADDCTISIVNGPSDNLKVVKVLTPSASGTSYTFTPSGLPSDTYAIKIADNKTPDQINYSIQFSYQGTGSASASTSSGVTTTSSPSQTTTNLASTTTGTETGSATNTPYTSRIMSSNSTMTSHSSKPATKTRVATGSNANITPSTVPNQNAAGRASSQMALVAGVIAALAYFN
ncbi:hypothetical protein DCS_04701 [Drechmeria coniospora]|uniref:Yeast cell wall synthesis Kre9/Knh1-like N-terminal domain-containing protein n=1 Tax=Drechmeria coniospora TaxID=98403 RepID=A0A151GKR9_DRECN|nr:hypothetical protein DCS_04701 [Drechmeria coniospora]KYK57688.1 hypothetical protein DCS_04701 [Drechmeria coniospora]